MTHAVVMRALGGPEVLGVEELELLPLAARDIRVRMEAAAVNHSDLEIRRGAWPIGPRLRAAVADIVALVRAGKLAAPAWQTFPLARAGDAHAQLEARGGKGRGLLVP